jgi:hypothetical protein
VLADLLADVPFVAGAVLVAYLGMVGPRAVPDRGWFPGGDEDDPAPQPQPEEGK